LKSIGEEQDIDRKTEKLTRNLRATHCSEAFTPSPSGRGGAQRRVRDLCALPFRAEDDVMLGSAAFIDDGNKHGKFVSVVHLFQFRQW